MDPLSVASSMLLSRVIPVLMGISDSAAQAAAQQLGQTLWQRVHCWWNQLWPRLHDRPAAARAVRRLAAKPNSTTRQDRLAHELADVLRQQPELTTLTQSLLKQLPPGWLAGHVITAGSTVNIEGDDNIVSSGTYSLVIRGNAGNIRLGSDTAEAPTNP